MLFSISATLRLKKIKIYKKFVQGLLKKKNLKLAPKDIIFEVLEVDRGNSQFFMTDSFFQSKNTGKRPNFTFLAVFAEINFLTF